MKPQEIFEKVQSLVGEGNIDKAKAFIEDNKDNLGEYFDKAKGLLEGNDMVKGALDSVKGLFDGK